ncbi:uncharacterized protein [Apostichopus japonicus]|uniref:uncharacterized protein n=1 Tax=Stichopus japonicus TaxID=307972 RepID=UPI003AB8706E
MHFVVGLAEQASSTMKVWEQMIFGEEKVGALAVTGFAGKDEGGTERLVRTVCKGVQDRGCEKSGKAAQFRAFLSAEFGVNDVPLAPFKGNRFNILFHNGAGVYHLYKHLLVFFNRHKSENKLMLAVAADLEVPQYIAGVKSLGIIDKVITGPLWRAMEKEKHVLAMNERYDRLLECLAKWSKDSTDLLTGSDILYSDVPLKKNSVYDSLMKPCELDGMVKQLLEMLCSSFKMLSERMLSEHLKGGKYSRVSADQHREMQSVPTTNTTVERDFGMLDRLMREKPSASCIALEAMIMYKRNKTSEWSASLEDSQRSFALFLKLAQKSKAQQKKAYADRLATIKAAREQKELGKKAAILKKADQDRARKLLLGKEIKSVGGLAESASELDQRLSELKSVKGKSKYLQTQLKYRRFVLGARNEGGVLNVSAGGKPKTVEQLKISLLGVIVCDNEELEAASTSFQNRAIGLAPVDAVEAFKSRLQPPPAKKTRLTSGSNIKLPEELVDKRIEHHTEEEGKVDWYKGTVVGAKGAKYFVRYDGFPRVYSYKAKEIEEDIQAGDLQVLILFPGCEDGTNNHPDMGTLFCKEARGGSFSQKIGIQRLFGFTRGYKNQYPWCRWSETAKDVGGQLKKWWGAASGCHHFRHRIQ